MLALSTSFTQAIAQNVVLIEEDYEAASRVLNSGNNGAAVEELPDPAVGGTDGTVAAVDLSGPSQWGAVNVIPQSNLALPVASVAGDDTFFATIDVYIDSANTTFNAGETQDRFNLIFRFNRGIDDADRVTISNNNAWESLLMDEWNTITIPEQVIPEVDQTGAPITHVLPIISLRDQGPDDGGIEAEPGIAAYFDNFRIDVSVPNDDPNLASSPLSFGRLEASTGPHTLPLTVLNSGTNNPLTITGATFSGADAAQFSLTDATFPMTIDAGASADLQVTFSPGSAIGDFVADLVLASNDESDEMVNISVSAAVEPPFAGIEMIINGDFEMGDLTAWRDDDRFDYTEDQAHGGSGAAIFNLTGSQQWGEARLSTTSPPATVDDQEAIAITPEMIGKKYQYSAWYFRPSTDGPEPDDTIMAIFRWNAINPGNHTLGRFPVGDPPFDTWFKVFGEGVIPELDNEGVPVDRVVPLWSFQDVVRDDVPGRHMFIDDVSFKIEGEPPLPDLQFTEIEVDEDASVVRVTWTSAPGLSYSIDRATVLNGVWLEEIEDYPADDGETTTWEDTTALGLGETRLFYRVRLLSQ